MTDYRLYFKGNEDKLKKLEELHDKKYRLKKLLDSQLGGGGQPFIVEFSGLPRTGKSESTDKVYEFFKQANIRIEKTKEPAQIIKDSMSKEEVSKMTNLEFNNKTLEISKEELKNKISNNPSIIIQDRGVIDNYFWYQMMYEDGNIDNEVYEQILLRLYQDLMNIDQLFIMLAKPEIIIFRDYLNQIYLENRKKTTLERVSQLRQGFDQLLPLIKSRISENKLIELDTSDIDEIETSIIIADKIMDGIYDKVLCMKNQKS